jgi:hypothetical protein
MSDPDWHWSGQAQRKTEVPAKQLALRCGLGANYLQVDLGSRFTYEKIGHYIDQHSHHKAADYVRGLIESDCSPEAHCRMATPSGAKLARGVDAG